MSSNRPSNRPNPRSSRVPATNQPSPSVPGSHRHSTDSIDMFTNPPGAASSSSAGSPSTAAPAANAQLTTAHAKLLTNIQTTSPSTGKLRKLIDSIDTHRTSHGEALGTGREECRSELIGAIFERADKDAEFREVLWKVVNEDSSEVGLRGRLRALRGKVKEKVGAAVRGSKSKSGDGKQ